MNEKQPQQIQAPSQKKINRMGAAASSIPGKGRWGGLNRRVMVVGVGIHGHMEYRDEEWWHKFRQAMGVK